MKKIIVLISVLFCMCGISAQEITGSWHGLLDVKVAKMRLVFNLAQDGEQYTATMDSPDQGAKDIPVTSVLFKENLLTIEVKPLNMVYTGVIKGDSIVGTFSQMGQGFPLTLTRKELLVLRPQEPKAPFLYHSEDLTFYNSKADINLAGTLTYPIVGSNFPAVVLITGSGPQNRDEELMGHKPFLVISDYLTNRGIAVLRFDDRGVAKSEGDFAQGTTEDFATDAMAAVEYLKSRKEIDSSKIGLIGHSEGGIISFLLAGRFQDDISFIVSMAGTAFDGETVTRKQREIISKKQGISDTQIEMNEVMVKKLIAIAQSHTKEEIENNLDSLVNSCVPESMRSDERVMTATAAELKKITSSPWMLYFMKNNPADDIVNIKCPIFAINGDKDLQVDAEQNIAKIKELQGANKGLKTKIYPSLNHLFQTCITGLLTEYSTIEETISPEVLKDMADWIKMTTKK